MSWQKLAAVHHLKISIISLSGLEDSYRLDAEYYSPEFLAHDGVLGKHTLFPFGKLVDKIDVGFVGSMVSEYAPIGASLLQTQHVREFFIDDAGCKKINELFHKKLKKSQVHHGDILIARSGSFGNASIYLGDEIVNSADIIIAEAKKEIANSFYLVAFLNSKYGRFQLYRFASGGLQGHVNLTILEKLKVAVPGPCLQKAIEHKIRLAHQKYQESKLLMKKAEGELGEELNLQNKKLVSENISTRFLSEVLEVDRFDAEYWQPKYDALLKDIRAFGKVSTIGEEFEVIKNNFEPEENKTYKYIEIGDVSISSGSVDFTEKSTSELPDNAKIEFGERQLIASKVRPNRGAVTILNNHKGYVGSGAFTALKEKGNIPLEILMVYLKTESIRDLLLRYNVGSSYPVIRDENILNLPIPQLGEKIKLEIVQKVTDACSGFIYAKALTERIKSTIDIFIEEGENAALSFIGES